MKLTVSALLLLSASAHAAPVPDHVKAFSADLEGITFGDSEPMKLHLLNDTTTSGAVCLDGTPAGFYFSPATDPKVGNHWQLYFQGGG